MKRKRLIITQLALCLCIFGQTLFAQTTAFTFQGSLKNSGSPATGNYDLEFKMFDLASGGSQIGSTLQKPNVPVTNGIFTVSLDFGAASLPGADRFIEIGIRLNGNPGSFQQLLPRQPVTSAPYAVRSLNATSADTILAAGIPAGNGNYIQNTTSPQASSDFSISGNGIAGGTLSGNVVNTATQYNIGGNRVFTVNGSFSGTTIFTATNTFAGDMAGINTSPNPDPTGATGKFNSFYGVVTGRSNSTGFANSFFGAQAGWLNITGNFNSFFGTQAGYNNTLSSYNSFFGAQAGNNTSFAGGNNSFFGSNAGYSNTSGSNNTIVGTNADVLSNSLTNAGAFGYQAAVGSSNSLVLGSISGINGATANTNIGIGTTTPLSTLQIQDGGTNAAHIRIGGNVVGSDEKIITFGDWGCSGAPCVYLGERAEDDRLEFRAGKFVFVIGALQAAVLGSGGNTALCRNANNEISTCSSSLRYKKNINPFSSGISFVNQLHPISFDWKDGGMKDVGFGAEDIAKIDPRFVTFNDKGEVEGVKYDRLSAAFVNAFKEQQTQIENLQTTNAKQQTLIESQQKQNDELQKQVNDLKMVVCSIRSDAEICKAKGETK